MELQRHRGFVVGYDQASEVRLVWKVRVKDRASPYNGHKLIVASVRGGLELARGLNVHFVIGTLDDPSGAKLLRAVDVCLETPENQVKQVNMGQEGSCERERGA